MNCPFCAEEIKDNAQVCKHCGRDFLFVRPLLDQVLGAAKRLDQLEENFASLAQAQQRVQRRADLAAGIQPVIHRGSAIAFTVLSLFIAGLFISTAIVSDKSAHAPAAYVKHAPVYISCALIFLPLIFGFLCESGRVRHLSADFGTALFIAIVAVIGIQIVRWEIIGDYFLPYWTPPPTEDDDILYHGAHLPNSWLALFLNATTIFVSFMAGAYFRYCIQVWRQPRHASVASAPSVSTRIATRWYQNLGPAELENAVKRWDSIIKASTALAYFAGGSFSWVWVHFWT